MFFLKKNLVKRQDTLNIYVDGASRSNPGPSSYAFIFILGESIIKEKSEYLGEMTNNQAEYEAIKHSLKEAEKETRWKIKLFSDSKLAVNQLNKQWRITKEHLSKLCDEIYSQIRKFDEVKIFHVPRDNEYIQRCDELCNRCLDDEGF
ncbi:MAG: reverse transcriptase-like protein [Candidatus Lokiarchaeota archaeon]|nr:reverse transcriptase-like protein [Candidatus Lokiarchaeota archaeon]